MSVTTGLFISFLTVVAIIAFIYSIKGAFILLDKFADFFEKDGNVLLKLILFLPWITLTLLCIVLQFFIYIVAIFTGYQLAVGVRDWMNKGK